MNEYLLITALFAILVGFFIVQYLVQIPSKQGLYTVLMMIALIGLAYSLILAYREQGLFIAVLLSALGLLIGYIAANALLLKQEDHRNLPAITRTDGGDGHTAILYFTHGEPPGYDPLPWIETIQEFDHDEVPFVPWLIRPFFFNRVRAEYYEAGGSAHNKLHQVFFDTLKRSMSAELDKDTRFYLAFLDSNPRPDEMVIHAINAGASRIILLPIFITESTHTLAGQEMVAEINPEQYGVAVCYTGALWDSESLQRVFVERALEMSDTIDKAKVGVLLVGHGQPTQWEKRYPAQNQQETQYRQAIREKLIEAGFSREQISLGWMEFLQPSITQAIRELANRNPKKILVFSVSLSADSIHSDVEVPAAVAKAKISDAIQVEYIGQYGDHPLAIRAMREKIANCR